MDELELERAVEQFHDALDADDYGKHCHGREGGWVDGSTVGVVEALLEAGWRPPPEVMSEEPWIKRPDGSSFRRGYIDYFGPRS